MAGSGALCFGRRFLVLVEPKSAIPGSCRRYARTMARAARGVPDGLEVHVWLYSTISTPQ